MTERAEPRAVTAAGGLRRFAGYAMAPNERGFCGPTDHRLLADRLRAGGEDDELAALVKGFDGPLPYLRLIAGANGIDDPFDPAVVEAYWLGNELLDAVDPHDCADALIRAFAGQPTVDPRRIAATADGASPHHGYHVMVTYPWMDLVAAGRVAALVPLDSCRIRPAEVMSVQGQRVTVLVRPLELGEQGVCLGAARTVAVRPLDRPDQSPVVEGDQVTLHWDHLCETLSKRETAGLVDRTVGVLDLVNQGLLGTSR